MATSKEAVLRVLRAFGVGLLAIAIIIVSTIWATTPSAPRGALLVPPKTDFTKGRYFAYVGPWGGELSAWTRSWSHVADGMILDLQHFPANTRIKWRWPPFSSHNGSGVWGYDFVAYDNYAGGLTEDPLPPIRVRDLKAFRQAFRWQIDDRWGDANVLTEFFLRSNTTDPDAHVIEIGWFLHAPKNMRRFFERSRSIGTYTDPFGRHWAVRISDKYCMFAPSTASDVPVGQLDMLDALHWLQRNKLITGDEWLWGVGIGAEPVKGMGSLTLQSWQVERR